MSLEKCRECGEQVSTAAQTCPKCGIKNPVKQKSNAAIWGVVIAVGIIIGVIVSVLAPTPSDNTSDTPHNFPDSAGALEESPCPENIATTPTQRMAAVATVREQGYDCASVYSMCNNAFSKGFTLSCNGSGGQRYKFEFEDHGGKWSVKAD